MDYKKARVIDKNGYLVDMYVVVFEDYITSDDDTETTQWMPYGYTLKDGESLLYEDMPTLRSNAGGTVGFVMPKWDGEQWVEGATNAEIIQWELDNPRPVTVTEPTEAEQLRADVDFLALMGGVTL